jgi:hypothetical protein
MFVSCTHPVHSYHSQHLQLDGTVAKQYLVDGLVEQLSGIPVHLVLLPDGYYSSARRIIKAIDGKKHRTELKNKFHIVFNEINHKIDMKVKKDCQVIISPLLQSMLGFRQVYSRRGSMLQIE